MGRIFDAVIEHLDKNALRYERVVGRDAIRISFTGSAAVVHCRLTVDEDPGLVQFWVYLPVFVPAERRGAAAEFVARANCGLRLGNFDLDFQDGEVRYHTSAWPGEGPFVADQTEPVLQAALRTADRYLPALAKVIFANIEPQQAIFEVECGGDQSGTLGEIGRMLGDDASAPSAPDESTPPKPDDQASEPEKEDGEEPGSDKDAA